MKIPDILKNYKILVWLLLLIVSIIIIGPNFNPQGVELLSKEKNSSLPLTKGDIIYKINDAAATPDLLQKDYFGTVKLETSKGLKYVQGNGTLGASVRSVKSTHLNFGLDIDGGTRALVKPNETDNVTLSQVIGVLQTRINLYGLKEANFRPVYYDKHGFVEISIAGGTKHELTDLLERQGIFESKIPIKISSSAVLEFDKKYPVSVSNGVLIIDNKTYNNGDSFELSGIKFNAEVGNTTANLTATVFTSSDVILVYFDPQRSRIEPVQNGYRWFFQVQITKEGAERFSKITGNLDRYFDPSSSESYLSSKIYLYLDGELVDSLNIVADLKGQVIQEPSITGYAPTLDSATQSQRRLQSILRSGSLPTEVEIVQLDVISPKLGEGFLQNVVIAIFAAVAAVSVVIAIRYRKMKIILPMLVTSLSEVVIIFGMSVAIGWTIDLAAIAAIIAIIGTGIDAQIILIDQTLRGGEKYMTLKERVQRAFFIIVGAGGTVIGAMLPLMILGLGLLRGFAITTIIGVLIAIFITRPAFSEIIKNVA
ncbi:MAG: MMPL family transporter [Candidatus Aenigmarchaeota archaeon]|nr:MMPL family transporter [Candidatus Aenigmarchaeota archaeon]